MVHVTILFALALALGVGYPDAEAKKPATGDTAHERAAGPAQPQSPEASETEQDRGKARKRKPGRKKPHQNKPHQNKPNQTKRASADSEQPDGDAGKSRNVPNLARGEKPAKPGQSSEPDRPASPQPPTPGTTPPPPLVQAPARTAPPRVITGTDDGRSTTDGAAGRGPRADGDTLPLIAIDRLGSTSPASIAPLVRPLDELERSDESGDRDGKRGAKAGSDESSVSRTVREIVEVVPDSLKLALAGLVALSILLGGASLFTQLRARRLDAQRRELLQEVGLLQGALLPPVPASLGSAFTSVAYRPADGPGAGGDFYDAIPLPGGRAAFILGDISGHGRDALERTAFLRYTLRAYLEAGLEPRVVLQVAGRVIEDQLGGDFATVLIAIYDPHSGSLTYASAGHPAPIVTGPAAFQPVLVASSPPIGVGVPTGLRQTTLPLPPGSMACLYTDGLTEARTERGLVGRGRLTDLVEGLGRQGTAEELLERIAADARIVSDDMAACLITPGGGVTVGGFRTEQLELSSEDLDSGLARRFLEACGVPSTQADGALAEARDLTKIYGGTVLRVVFGNRLTVEALPRNVQSIEAASRQAAARLH